MSANSLPPDELPDQDTHGSFSDFIQGVKKIKSNTVEHKKPLMDPKISQMLKDRCTEENKEEELDFFSTANMEFVDPLDTISYKTAGLQFGVMRKLKAGEYFPQLGVDLHNNTIEQAYKKVRKLVIKAYREDVRCIIIVHGKGEFSTPKALLKSYVAHWLKMMPEVLAYHTAMPYHGDKGATYVLIKKGEGSRLETREIHSKRN
ncbi:MAG: Smr/MutS family protein [Ruminobacter sp.]|jgi:DNA-nicking Smr family endonuclease|uniref:DNA-nicking endonuclease, Smr domain n=1 Tax=Ruminobacter amylophilus TaxID=867 RepID=A0A662ZGK2_9GAMM|nr:MULTISPECIES: Smr/MutS family protein [Ruminobacter]MBQ3775540.1 Smr/MutS family protein [Ruminobacter sp.]SFP23965.1 DNA-nicking endonuclease, Smr domain [Ruminobacter amylophilus]